MFSGSHSDQPLLRIIFLILYQIEDTSNDGMCNLTHTIALSSWINSETLFYGFLFLVDQLSIQFPKVNPPGVHLHARICSFFCVSADFSVYLLHPNSALTGRLFPGRQMQSKKNAAINDPQAKASNNNKIRATDQNNGNLISRQHRRRRSARHLQSPKSANKIESKFRSESIQKSSAPFAARNFRPQCECSVRESVDVARN